MGQHLTFGDVCDAAFPATSQKWYQLLQTVISALEAVAILLFIYINRNSKHLPPTRNSHSLVDDDHDNKGYQSPQLKHFSLKEEDSLHLNSKPVTITATDSYRIFCILLPIYYKFLWILWFYCVYTTVYMALLVNNIGNDFGAIRNPFSDTRYISYHSLNTKQIINLILFGIWQYSTSTIYHMITFWFIQPSSGIASLKMAFTLASIIGIIEAICAVFAVTGAQHRMILLIFDLIIATFYSIIFFYMILHKKLRWRFFYFYIIFFIVLYVLYSVGDVFVIITKGALDGCMNELAEIMFECCIPIILALLLFDDSSYWTQFSRELIGVVDRYELTESVGRLDNKGNFKRVMDQLSMTIPVIKRSDVQFIGDCAFGSYSAVKKAKLCKTGELVAIKSLYSFHDENDEYVVEFMREAVLSWKLKHPNVVEFKGVLVDRSHRTNLCLVYEYMMNGALLDYLTKHSYNDTSISLKRRIKFVIDAAKGITCLHSHNIIHRDINCRNLLIDSQLIVKVCDFGTCRKVHYVSGGVGALIKQMTAGIGTVAYMAPEVLKHVDCTKKLKSKNATHKITYDFAIDMFSFGGVLYEVMTSKELYKELTTSLQVQQFVLSGNREKIPKHVIDILNVPNSYCELMLQCWSQQALQRPQFKDIVLRLQSIAKGI